MSFWLCGRPRRPKAHQPEHTVRLFTFAIAALTVLPASAVERSRIIRAEFMRQNPCPATASTRGACPGYQVDHREALICGGRDELQNLQWLTVDEHKAKTRAEVKLCRPRAKS